MKHIKSIVSLLLALTLALSLTACGSQANTEPEQPDDTPTTAEVNLYVLSGPTGIGAMNLWAAADAGETENTYHITMSGANDEVVAAISKGEADIAAVATNMAAALYNKTEGGVTVLAVNTLGVLSLLGNGQEAASIADLAGKTIYAPGQGANPEYILRYVLTGNGLDHPVRGRGQRAADRVAERPGRRHSGSAAGGYQHPDAERERREAL